MIERGGSPDAVEKFWTRLLAFASYAFNKSHAAAYSVVSYYTAWLKYYYPCEYLSSQLSYTPEKLGLFMPDIKAAGLELLPPDINTGVPNFAPDPKDNKKIRFGIKAIKGVSAAAQLIYDLRDTHAKNKDAHHLGVCIDYHDFIARATVYGIDIGVCSALIRAGACDCLMKKGETRRQYEEVLSVASDFCRKYVKSVQKAHPELIGDTLYQNVLHEWVLPVECQVQMDEFDLDTKLGYEFELLGAYVSDSPIHPYLHQITDSNNRSKSIAELMPEDTRNILIAGRIRDLKILYRKSDHMPMAKFMLDDETGTISCVMFTQAFGEYGKLIDDGKVVSLNGGLKSNDNGDEASIAKEFWVKTAVNILPN